MNKCSVHNHLCSVGAIAFLGIVLAGCMIPGGEFTRRGSVARVSVPPLNEFDRCWSERTITLTAGNRGGSSALGPMMGMGSGGNGGGGGGFPLIVEATLFDSTLLHSAVDYYGKLASMDAGERGRFDSLYRATHDMHSSIYVWMQMRTSATPEFLDLDKWTIYLQNDRGDQTEPARIIPGSVRMRSDWGPGAEFMGGMQPGQDRWGSAQRNVELYFPLRRIGGGEFLASNAQHLKLIFLENDNSIVRAEGEWSFAASADN